MLEYIELVDLNDEIIDLYRLSFNEIEKIPLGNLRRALSNGGQLLAFYDNGFVGFTFSFKVEDRMFFVYFSTVPDVRGKGYGSKMLDILRIRNSDSRIFLVVEPCDDSAPDNDLRNRRKEFYRRNGCTDTGFQLISDDEWFDTMFVQGTLTEKEMVDTVRLYEDIHNGRQ